MEWKNPGDAWMFQGGVHDRVPLRNGVNALTLELFQAADATFDCHGRNHYPFNRIFAVHSAGEMRSIVRNHSRGGETLEMTPGSVIFISSGVDLEFEFRRDTQFFAFHFRVTADGWNLFAGCDLMQRRDGCSDTLRELETFFTRQNPDSAALCALKSLLLRETAAFLPPDRKPEPIRERYRALLEYIRTEADATTTVPELAEIFGTSPDSFSRAFSRDFKLPVKRYLAAELVTRAGKLLRSTPLSVKEIAMRLGFTDEFYFSRFFRRNTGISPSEYRRNAYGISSRDGGG